MNSTDETNLEQAIRHVAEAEERYARHLALVERMAASGEDTADAESLLTRFEQTLDLMRQHHQLVLNRSQDKS
jgi:hypothetical protein